MDIFYEVLKNIRIHILGGLIIYSLIFFILKLFFSKKKWLIDTDEKVIKLIVDLSLFCFVVSTLIVLGRHFFVRPHVYLPASIVQNLLWFGLPNLLRFKALKRMLLLRVLVGILFVVDVNIVGAVIAAWNSYEAWGGQFQNESSFLDTIVLSITIWYVVLGIILKLITIVSVSYLYDYLRQKVSMF
ncbi:hypothetical protein [Wenyingzhuangia sp. IMCC45574]